MGNCHAWFWAGENLKITSKSYLSLSFTHLKPNIYSLPTLNEKPCSFCITDPKGEVCNDTAEFLRQHGYKIKVLNLNEPKYSDCYNPFKYVRDNRDLEIVVDSVVKGALGDGGGSDKFWNDAARSLIESISFYLYYECPYKDQNFATVCKFLNMCGDRDENKKLPSTYEAMLDKLEKTSPLGKEHLAIKKYSICRQSKGNTFSSILSSTQGAVRLFNSKDIARLTMTDTLQMDMIGDEPTALFVITSTTNSTFDFLVSLIYTQMFETLLYRANTVYAKQGHSLPHHINFFLDEFANIAQIPDFDKKIAVFRQANISCDIIVQTPNQIESIYKEKADNIIGNTTMTLFLGNSGLGDKSASEWLAKGLGKQTIIMTTPKEENERKKSILMNGTSYRDDYSKMGRELMTADEIRRLGGNQCIVLISGQQPFLDEKVTPMDALNYEEAKNLFYDIPKFKDTSKSYKKGLAESAKKDEEIQKSRMAEALEDAKFMEFETKEKTKEVKDAHIMSAEALAYSEDDINEADFMEEDSVISFSPTHEWDLPEGQKVEDVVIIENWEEDEPEQPDEADQNQDGAEDTDVDVTDIFDDVF